MSLTVICNDILNRIEAVDGVLLEILGLRMRVNADVFRSKDRDTLMNTL